MVRHTPRKKIVICISGLAGSGKSTASRRIAQHFGLKYYSGGEALKVVAASMGYETGEKGWWETDTGLDFLRKRLNDLNMDRKVDEQLLKWAEEGDAVLDSWTMPWLLKGGFKIWLEASQEVRAQRVAERDKISVEEASRYLMEKENKTKEIYRRLYGFNLGQDVRPFHLILDVNMLNQEEVFEAIRLVINNALLVQKGRFRRKKHIHNECPASGERD